MTLSVYMPIFTLWIWKWPIYTYVTQIAFFIFSDIQIHGKVKANSLFILKLSFLMLDKIKLQRSVDVAVQKQKR